MPLLVVTTSLVNDQNLETLILNEINIGLFNICLRCQINTRHNCTECNASSPSDKDFLKCLSTRHSITSVEQNCVLVQKYLHFGK